MLLSIPQTLYDIVFDSGIAHYLKLDELGVSELIEMSFLGLVVSFFMINAISDYVTNQEKKAAEREEELRLQGKSQCERISIQEYAQRCRSTTQRKLAELFKSDEYKTYLKNKDLSYANWQANPAEKGDI